jgi:hypothetical protein
MIRNLKTLGLAFAVVFTLSAVVASGASAQSQGRLTSDGQVTLDLTGEVGAIERITAQFAIECPNTPYTGHQYNTTPHAFVPSGSTTITVTPKYVNCAVTPGGFPVTVDMNGCDYVLHIGETTGGVAGTYGITFDVICPAGNEITITVFLNPAKHGENKLLCKMHIKSQFGLTGLHATDTGKGDIRMLGTLEGMHVSSPSGGGLSCGNTTTEGKYDFNLTLKGRTEAGTTAISLSH